MSITASRRLASPTGPSMCVPWSSGPRWAIASPIRRSTPSWTTSPSRRRMPAIPHIGSGALDRGAQLGDDGLLLGFGELGVHGQRQRQAVGEERVRELLRPQTVLGGVVAERDGGVRALPGGDALLLEALHDRVAALVQRGHVGEAGLLRAEEGHVGLPAVHVALG